LQVKMPSPVDGIFQPAINLGEIINKGDVWGKIFNPINMRTTEVRAEQDGLVFLIRSLAKVKMGDSLGGVLPITRNGKVVIDG
jgi:predicted deacylase